MEVNTMEVGEIDDVDGEEVATEDMDYAKLIKQKRRVAGETGPELSSDEELRAQLSTVRNSKNPKKSSNDGVKQSSNKKQYTNKSQDHNQARREYKTGPFNR
jgi:hypothetical protein